MAFFQRLSVTLATFGGLFLFSGPAAQAGVIHVEMALCPDPGAQSRPVVFNASIGDQATFFVDEKYDSAARTQITATLRASQSKSLVYIEDTYYAALSSSSQQALLDAAVALGNEFDATIYPNITGFYGAPSEPGIDGDQRITILLTKLISSAGGYVNTGDEYLRSQYPRSNEREMVYVNALYATQTRRINSFLAHEFTHLVTFNQKDKLRSAEEEIWLNELRAEYAPARVGYETPLSGSILASRANIFFTNPSDSLTEWKNVEADYGSANLFAQYVSGHYGASLLSRTMQTSATGVASFEEAFAATGSSDRFADAVQHWATANFLNTVQPGGLYAYKQTDLASYRVTAPTASLSLNPGETQIVSRQIEDWAGQWIQAQIVTPNNETLRVTVSADVPPRAEVILKKTDGTSVVQQMMMSGKTGSFTIPTVSGYTAVTVVPIMMGETSGFTTGGAAGYPDEPLRSYSVMFERSAAQTVFVDSVSPGQLVTFGGTSVTVRGFGFLQGTPTVTLDGQTVAANVLNDTTLTFIAPAHSAGSVCVRVVVNTQTAERCDIVSYIALANGSLLRAQGSPEVWIVNGAFRRHIVSSRVFEFYNHLSWSSVLDVSPDVVAQYRLSAWARLPVTGDPVTWRVYEVNGDASKHWITCADENQCGAIWIARGGDPAGIFTINGAEMSFYTEGPRVFLQ